MSDIVEQLRARAARHSGCEETFLYYGAGDKDMDEEAAAEIEALRERVREAEKAIRGADAYLTPDELSSFSEYARVQLARQLLRVFLATKEPGDE